MSVKSRKSEVRYGDWTAVHVAACYNDTEMMKLLLDGMNDDKLSTVLSLQDECNRTVVHIAVV